jgi:hypothetical protein
VTIAEPDLPPYDPERLLSPPLPEQLEQDATETGKMRALQPWSTGGYAEALLRTGSTAGAC